MNYEKITENDITGKGNVGMPDIPMLSAREMQAKLDELSRDVIIPKFNALIDRLTQGGEPVHSATIAALRINDNGDLEITTDGEIWLAVADYKLSLKADKADTYTKTETERAINQKVVEIGTGDMAKAVYDTDGDGKADIANDSEKLAGELPEYYATKEEVQAANTAAESAQEAADTAQTTADGAMPKSAYVLSGTTLTITF